MKTLLKIFSHSVFIFGLLVFIAIQSNTYSWMKDMDPSMTTLPVADGSGNRTIFMFLLLIVIVTTQIGTFFIAKGSKEKAVSIVLVIVAISLWSSRYW